MWVYWLILYYLDNTQHLMSMACKQFLSCIYKLFVHNSEIVYNVSSIFWSYKACINLYCIKVMNLKRFFFTFFVEKIKTWTKKIKNNEQWNVFRLFHQASFTLSSFFMKILIICCASVRLNTAENWSDYASMKGRKN